jgi:hypothetical protein
MLDRALLLVYPKAWSYGHVDNHYRRLSQELRKTYASRVEPASDGAYDPVAGSIRVSVKSISRQFAENEAMLRLLRAQLALQEYRAKHGDWPATLADLTLGVVAQVPVDPFTGNPLKYRRKGGEVLLYSVGWDLKDDGGISPVPGRTGATRGEDLVYGVD